MRGGRGVGRVVHHRNHCNTHVGSQVARGGRYVGRLVHRTYRRTKGRNFRPNQALRGNPAKMNEDWVTEP